MLQSNTHQILFAFESLDLCLVAFAFLFPFFAFSLCLFFFCCVHKTNLRIKFGLVFILFWLVPAFYVARFVFSFSFSFFRRRSVGRFEEYPYRMCMQWCGNEMIIFILNRCAVAIIIEVHIWNRSKIMLCCCKGSLFWLWWWLQFKPLSIDRCSLPQPEWLKRRCCHCHRIWIAFVRVDWKYHPKSRAAQLQRVHWHQQCHQLRATMVRYHCSLHSICLGSAVIALATLSNGENWKNKKPISFKNSIGYEKWTEFD